MPAAANDPHIPAIEHRPPGQLHLPLSFWASAFIVLVCLSLITMETWQAWHNRKIQLEESKIATSNLAQSVAQHTHDSIKAADTALFGLVDRAENKNTANNDKALHDFLTRRIIDLPQLQSLSLYDAHGQISASSLTLPPSSITEQAYYQYHQTHPEKSLHISPPSFDSVSNSWVFAISRRVNGANGQFDGIALALIDINYFRQYHARFDIGKQGAIFVALNSGIVVLRRPFDTQMLGRDVSGYPLFQQYLSRFDSGTEIFRSKIDNINRINSFRRLEDYPLVVSAALSQDEVLADWRKDTWQNGIVVGTMLLLFAYLGIKLVKQIDLRNRAESELILARQSLENLNSTLQQLATQDSLTNLANRRNFDLALKTEFNRAMREASQLALIMIDVDCFKKYNDVYGHVAGDACLQAVAQAIAQCKKRASDLSARYGGEEFAVLLPGTDLDGACLLAEKIRKAIQELQIPHSGSEHGIVTISAGAHATCPQFGFNRAVELVETADKALYEAKHSGRNRVASVAKSERRVV